MKIPYKIAGICNNCSNGFSYFSAIKCMEIEIIAIISADTISRKNGVWSSIFPIIMIHSIIAIQAKSADAIGKRLKVGKIGDMYFVKNDVFIFWIVSYI